MTLDFSHSPYGLAVHSDFADAVPEALYYPEVEAQVKVQGELFVASTRVDPLVLASDKMIVVARRFEARIPELLQALTDA